MKNENEMRLDDLLDSALAQYGAAEPLHGLEDRVLGRLNGAGARRAWWMWGGVATAVAAAIVVVVLLARPAEQKPAPTAGAQSIPQQNVGSQSAVKQQSAAPVPIRKQPSVVPNANTSASLRPRAQGQPKLRPETAANALPRRDVFPTPMPPTEQERLLARYVRVTPRAEVLAQVNRKPLEFHEDPLSAPADGGGGASPQKAQGTK
jgi:hypothetical protein